MLNFRDPNKRLLLILSGVTVLSMGGSGWLSWSDWTEIGQLEESSQELQGRIDKGRLEIGRIAGLEEEMLVLRERVKEYVTILPDDLEITAFVDKLSTIAQATGVEITKLDDTAAKQRKSRKEKSAEAFDRLTYKLSLQATCGEFLHFLDEFENKYDRFVNISAFKLKGWEDRGSKHSGETVKDFPHLIDLELETYAYNAKTKGVDQVAIPKEAQKLEALRAKGRLEARAGDLKLARYDLKIEDTRRDPFLDPRLTLRVNGKVTEAERRHQVETLDGFKTRYRELIEAIAKEEAVSDAVRRLQMQEANNARLIQLDTDIAAVAQSNFFTVPEYAADFKAAILEPMQHLKEKRGSIPSVVIEWRLIEERVVNMEAALAAGDFKKALAIADEVQKLRPRVAPDDRLDGLFRRAEQGGAKASTYLDFAAMEFRFGGCVCYAGDPKQSVIIINDRSFSPGETVADGLVITAITKHDVTFDFRGVTVTRRHVGDGAH